jgi:hypothetical protein
LLADPKEWRVLMELLDCSLLMMVEGGVRDLASASFHIPAVGAIVEVSEAVVAKGTRLPDKPP